jgi:hypothetical protein
VAPKEGQQIVELGGPCATSAFCSRQRRGALNLNKHDQPLALARAAMLNMATATKARLLRGIAITAILLLTILPRSSTKMPDVIDCDVVIQAGHENTPDGMRGGEGALGKEIEWTPVVANEAVRILRQAGVNAVKETAHIKVTKQFYRCKLALFVHFDAPDNGEAGPSIGYPVHPNNEAAADEWKVLYKEYFPYKDTWLPDNVTDNHRFYYGYKYTVTTDAKLLVELGDLASLRQAEWLKPRLKWLGELLAYYVSRRIGKDGLQRPAPFGPHVAAHGVLAELGEVEELLIGHLPHPGERIDRNQRFNPMQSTEPSLITIP